MGDRTLLGVVDIRGERQIVHAGQWQLQHMVRWPAGDGILLIFYWLAAEEGRA